MADPWEWIPRELNATADWACNKAVDMKSEHFYQHDRCMELIRNRTNLIICSEGGGEGSSG